VKARETEKSFIMRNENRGRAQRSEKGLAKSAGEDLKTNRPFARNIAIWFRKHHTSREAREGTKKSEWTIQTAKTECSASGSSKRVGLQKEQDSRQDGLPNGRRGTGEKTVGEGFLGTHLPKREWKV